MNSESVQWSELRLLAGTVENVPAAICDMLAATFERDAYAAFRRLDNWVVVQGQVQEAAPATARLLLSKICSGEGTQVGIGYAMDLVFELSYGDVHISEIERGNTELGNDCREIFREYLSCIIGLAEGCAEERILLGVLDVVDRLETDQAVRQKLGRSFDGRKISPEAQESLRDLMS